VELARLLVTLVFLVPFLGLVGIILVLIGMKSLADYYNEPGIFQNALYDLIFGIMGIIVAGIVLVSMFSADLFSGALMGSCGSLGFSLVSDLGFSCSFYVLSVGSNFLPKNV